MFSSFVNPISLSISVNLVFLFHLFWLISLRYMCSCLFIPFKFSFALTLSLTFTRWLPVFDPYLFVFSVFILSLTLLDSLSPPPLTLYGSHRPPLFSDQIPPPPPPPPPLSLLSTPAPHPSHTPPPRYQPHRPLPYIPTPN